MDVFIDVRCFCLFLGVAGEFLYVSGGIVWFSFEKSLKTP